MKTTMNVESIPSGIMITSESIELDGSAIAISVSTLNRSDERIIVAKDGSTVFVGTYGELTRWYQDERNQIIPAEIMERVWIEVVRRRFRDRLETMPVGTSTVVCDFIVWRVGADRYLAGETIVAGARSSSLDETIRRLIPSSV